MPEDIEENGAVTEAAPVVEDSSYSEILAGQAEAPIKPEAGEVTEDKTTPEVSEKEAPTTDEVILEIGGKEYAIKQADLLEYLSNQSKFADREKSLTEKEKSLNRDYTQKSQQVAEFRKSLEGAFGRMPLQDEIKALGQVWNAYFKNPQAKQAIDAILSGRFDVLSKGASTQEPGKQADPYVSQLEQQIADLREQLGTFTESMTERERNEKEGQAKKTWDGWVAKQSEAGVKITDEIDAKMAPFITALKVAHPDWESSQILDKAYKHATIEDIQKTTVSNVLKSVDKAKQSTLPRIKPKSTAQSDSQKTYSDILLNK